MFAVVEKQTGETVATFRDEARARSFQRLQPTRWEVKTEWTKLAMLEKLFPNALERVANVILANGGPARKEWEGQTIGYHLEHASAHAMNYLDEFIVTDEPDLDHATVRLLMALELEGR